MSIDVTAARGGQDAGGGRARAYLQLFLQDQDNVAGLQAIICGYVARLGLATGDNIAMVAAEVFQDAAIEVLAHANRFNPDMQPRAWFLAIAATILKRHRANTARRSHFEVLVSNLASKAEQESEHDLLDQLMASTDSISEPEQALISREGARELLAMVSPEEARLLNLALIQGWDANALSSMMGITTGTVRVRVHRALNRLKEAWRISEQRKERDKSHG